MIEYKCLILKKWLFVDKKIIQIHSIQKDKLKKLMEKINEQNARDEEQKEQK
jgi:hypothetical protein